MCACTVGANSGQKDTKRPKTQVPLLKSPERKQRVASKSRVLSMPPAQHTTRGVGKTPKPPPAPPLDTPLLSLPRRNRLATPPQGASKGTCYLFSLPAATAGAPVKTCLNFLSGL